MFFYRTHKGWKEIRKEGREGRQKGRGSKQGQVIISLFVVYIKKGWKGGRKEEK